MDDSLSLSADLTIEDVSLLEEDSIELEKQESKFKEIHSNYPIMTLEEMINLLKARIDLLNRGYKTTIEDIVKKENLSKSEDIAKREFELGKMPPFSIKRNFPNGEYEIWKYKDFKYFPI